MFQALKRPKQPSIASYANRKQAERIKQVKNLPASAGILIIYNIHDLIVPFLTLLCSDSLPFTFCTLIATKHASDCNC